MNISSLRKFDSIPLTRDGDVLLGREVLLDLVDGVGDESVARLVLEDAVEVPQVAVAPLVAALPEVEDVAEQRVDVDGVDGAARRVPRHDVERVLPDLGAPREEDGVRLLHARLVPVEVVDGAELVDLLPAGLFPVHVGELLKVAEGVARLRDYDDLLHHRAVLVVPLGRDVVLGVRRVVLPLDLFPVFQTLVDANRI